jgi:hypothetical protein
MVTLKRRYERIEIQLPCRLFIPEGGKSRELKFEAFATSRNLSLGGVFLESLFLMKPTPFPMITPTTPRAWGFNSWT